MSFIQTDGSIVWLIKCVKVKRKRVMDRGEKKDPSRKTWGLFLF